MPGSVGTLVSEPDPSQWWVPLVFIQGELALSSIQRRVASVFERMLGSVILQPILPSVANA